MSTTATEQAQIVRQGNKLLIAIDEDMVKQLGLNEHTALKVSSDGASLIFTPTTPVSSDFVDAMKRVHVEWSDVFKKLAG